MTSTPIYFDDEDFLPTIKVTREIDVTLSPSDLGKALANLGDDQQAEALLAAVEVLDSVGGLAAGMQASALARRMVSDARYGRAVRWLEELVELVGLERSSR